MNELDLYKFLEKNNVETQWQKDEKGVFNLAIWVPHYALKEFCEMLGASAFDDGGICETCLCRDASVYVGNFDYVCECYGIDPERIVPKDIEQKLKEI